MIRVSVAQGRIYNWFHASKPAQAYFFTPANDDTYAAYYTSMYLIQDTAEAVSAHIRRGFSKEPMQAYIEFWGVMQATTIQQDAICELYKAVVGDTLKTGKLAAWNNLREKRNLCAGHPSNRSHGRPRPQRAFMGRAFGDYRSIRYEVWDAHSRKRTHPTFSLLSLIDGYAAEVEAVLLNILNEMKVRWP
jgi:hypothetical protein